MALDQLKIMIDEEKIKQAIKLIIEAIGDDVDREGLKETPDRIARMYAEIFSGMEEDAKNISDKTFRVYQDEIILEKDIQFYSMCEHHSQLQERMTAQIADALMDHLWGKGAMVILEAEHMCMTMRGVKKTGNKTVTAISRGSFTEDLTLRNEVFRMAGF